MPEPLAARLRTLCIYRNLLHTPAVETALRFFSCLESPKPEPDALLALYGEMFFALRTAGHGDFGSLLRHETAADENPFSLAASNGTPEEALFEAAARDFAILNALAELGGAAVKRRIEGKLGGPVRGALEGLPDWNPGEPISLEEAMRGYRENGCGIFSAARAFIWENETVCPVLRMDPIKSESMTGYERQRNAVMQNTRVLLRGGSASDMLLYGDSGTGKSATVKALMNHPDCRNLRIIEIPKASAGELRPLLRQLAGRTQKFILFIDDISFDREDPLYAPLKSILEGGLEARPGNVAVYATSNRRHLVRETFSEREGDDLHRSETLQEKTSLADRFGLQIPFLSLTKAEFFETAKFLARREGLEISGAALEEQANKWELSHGHRTPRAARQLIQYLAGISDGEI